MSLGKMSLERLQQMKKVLGNQLEMVMCLWVQTDFYMGFAAPHF